jgi:hypothetical protein
MERDIVSTWWVDAGTGNTETDIMITEDIKKYGAKGYLFHGMTTAPVKGGCYILLHFRHVTDGRQ